MNEQTQKLPEEMRGQFSWLFVEQATEQAIASYLRSVATGEATETRQALRREAERIESGAYRKGGQK